LLTSNRMNKRDLCKVSNSWHERVVGGQINKRSKGLHDFVVSTWFLAWEALDMLLSQSPGWRFTSSKTILSYSLTAYFPMKSSASRENDDSRAFRISALTNSNLINVQYTKRHCWIYTHTLANK
jgi:hypothetical protein